MVNRNRVVRLLSLICLAIGAVTPVATWAWLGASSLVLADASILLGWLLALSWAGRRAVMASGIAGIVIGWAVVSYQLWIFASRGRNELAHWAASHYPAVSVILGILLLGLGAAIGHGVVRRQRWAFVSSLLLAGLLFVSACVLVWHLVGWVGIATYMDRPGTRREFVQLLAFFIALFGVPALLSPVIWLVYHLRPGVRAQFQKTT